MTPASALATAATPPAFSAIADLIREHARAAPGRRALAQATGAGIDAIDYATLDARIHGEMDRISQALTQRVKELADRYDTPAPQMASRVAELEARVNRHLEKMGFVWN